MINFKLSYNFIIFIIFLIFINSLELVKANKSLKKRQNNDNNNNSNSSSEGDSKQICSDKAGQVIVMTPTKNNLALIGFPLNISWKYSPFTNLETYPKGFINIYYQQTNDGDGLKPDQWKGPANENKLGAGTTSWNWTIPQLPQGSYAILVAPDDRLDYDKGCFAAGQPRSGKSGDFILRQRNTLPVFKDPYPPFDERGDIEPKQYFVFNNAKSLKSSEYFIYYCTLIIVFISLHLS